MHVYACVRENVYAEMIVHCGHICRPPWKATQLLSKSETAVSPPAVEKTAVSLVEH